VKRILFMLLLASIAHAEPLTLAKAIDIALTNNPQTRTTYLQARAAEAALGSARSAYLPEIDINATAGRVRNSTQPATNSFAPSVALSYLLFDFGGREAEVDLRGGRDGVELSPRYLHFAPRPAASSPGRRAL